MAIRPRQQNIFDSFGSNLEFSPEYGFNPSVGMNPNDMPPVNTPFGQTKSPFGSPFEMRGSQAPNVDFGQGSFDPERASTVPPPTPQTSDPNDLDAMINAINQVYTRDTTSRDRLNNLLDTAPQQRGPGIGRGIIAAGMALGNRPTAEIETFKQAPYLREMADWKAKADPYEKAAQLENTANINERTLAGNVVAAQRAAATQASREKIEADKNATAQERNRIREMHEKANWLKANDYIITKEGDSIIARKPGTLERISLGPSGGMDKADEIALLGKYRIEASRVAGESAAGRATQAGAQTYVDETGKPVVINPRDPKAVLPEGPIYRPQTKPGPTKPPSTIEQNRATQNKLKDLHDLDPIAKNHIKKNGTLYELRPRPIAGVSGKTTADVEEWDEVKRELDPNYVPSNVTPATTTRPAGVKGPDYKKDIELPAQGKTGIGPSTSTVSGSITKRTETAPMTREQQQQEVTAGRRLMVMDKNGNIVGTVANSQAEIDAAVKAGLRVKTGR